MVLKIAVNIIEILRNMFIAVGNENTTANTLNIITASDLKPNFIAVQTTTTHSTVGIRAKMPTSCQYGSPFDSPVIEVSNLAEKYSPTKTLINESSFPVMIN
jgi:hypothetical protein